MAGTKKEKKVVHHRDAKDGQYVTEEYAKKHPDTTVRETDRTSKKKSRPTSR